MFMQMVFSKAHPACHNIVNGIKPGSKTLNRLISMLSIAQKLYVVPNFQVALKILYNVKAMESSVPDLHKFISNILVPIPRMANPYLNTLQSPVTWPINFSRVILCRPFPTLKS